MICTSVFTRSPAPCRYGVGPGTQKRPVGHHCRMILARSQEDDKIFNKPEFKFDTTADVPGEDVRYRPIH